VPLRPLVFFSGLTFGDYVLWNWSLNSNLGVLALVAGLTLPPLALASLWLLGLAAARLLARTARRPRSARARRRARLASSRARAAAMAEQEGASASSGAPARKIAA
jgi:hypothetical protein